MAANSHLNMLDVYRRRAVFNVEKMAVLLEGKDVVTTRKKVWDMMAQDPLFDDPGKVLTLEQQRELAFKRVKRLSEYKFVSEDEFMVSPVRKLAYEQALMAYDFSVLEAESLSLDVSYNSILFIVELRALRGFVKTNCHNTAGIWWCCDGTWYISTHASP